jgi:predicted ester cyclase
MSVEDDNKAIVGRWFDEFWGNPWNPAVIDELAAPDIRFEYSMHSPCRGRDEVRAFATEFRAAFPDLGFGSLPERSGRTMRFSGTSVLRLEDGLIVEEIGLDDGVTVLKQLGLIPQS